MEIHMSELISISEVKKLPKGSNPSLEAKIITKPEPRTVNTKSGNTVQVCDLIIADGDESTENQMKLTLWGDDIASYNEGDVVVIENGYTNEFRGEVSVGKGRDGKITKKS